MQLTYPNNLLDAILGEPNKELIFTGKARHVNYERLRLVCQIIYCKPMTAYRIVSRIFKYFTDKAIDVVNESEPTATSICVKREKFYEVLRSELEVGKAVRKKSMLRDFEIALDILEQKRAIIVLLGGTSGSGKSTVASLLASRFGISTVLSTDTIRHILRNFLKPEDYPVLFASTYEAGEKLKEREDNKELSQKKRVLAGYLEQAKLVQERLQAVISNFQKRGESIVIEGVHLTPDFMLKLMEKYENCIPFIISIRNDQKHKERFAIRSKHMTIEKKLNKYVANFANIRCIHKHLVKTADEFLLPKVENTNVDKSLGIIHKTVLRSLYKMSVEGQSLYSKETKKANLLHEVFNNVTNNVWSSKAVKDYIEAKVNKKAIMAKFMQGAAESKPDMGTDEDDVQRRKNQNQQQKPQSVPQIGSQLDLIESIPRRSPSKGYAKAYIEDISDDQRNKKLASEEDNLDGNDEIEEAAAAEANNRKKNVRFAEETEFPEDLGLNRTLFPEKEELKIIEPNILIKSRVKKKSMNDKLKGPVTKEEDKKININDLEEYFTKNNVISFKKGIPKSHLKKIYSFLKTYNLAHKGQASLRLIYTNQRKLICKIPFDKSQTSDPVVIKLKPNEEILENTVKFRRKKVLEEDSQLKVEDSGGYSHGDSMVTSDQDAEVSNNDDEIKSNYSGNSYASGSMDVNVYGKSFRAFSDRPDISDDSGPDMKDELESFDEHLLEIDSDNSISEENEEFEEDSEDVSIFSIRVFNCDVLR